MKAKFFFFAAIFVAMATGAFAIVRTVSNNPNSPGQYTSLQAAVDAAGLTGDTIMVAGSPYSYGSIIIAKRLILVGAGYHNPYGSNTIVDAFILARSNEFVSSSGTKIMGFNVNGGISFSPNYNSPGGIRLLNNILIERCSLSSVYFDSWGNSNNNDTIRNCMINSGNISISTNWGGYVENIHIHNNIFNGAGFSSDATMSMSTLYVRNNIFINRAASSVFSGSMNFVIENNIFYAAYPTGGTGCAFTNNIGYMCPDMPGAGNIGSGNMNSTNPMFVNFPLLGAGFSWSYDFHLQAGSPGKNAGTDGTDIGIYGGMLPLEPGTNPHFPQMMTLTLPAGSSVPAGGTLNVHFTAKKQN